MLEPNNNTIIISKLSHTDRLLTFFYILTNLYTIKDVQDIINTKLTDDEWLVEWDIISELYIEGIIPKSQVIADETIH